MLYTIGFFSGKKAFLQNKRYFWFMEFIVFMEFTGDTSTESLTLMSNTLTEGNKLNPLHPAGFASSCGHSQRHYETQFHIGAIPAPPYDRPHVGLKLDSTTCHECQQSC